jgi:hypothetical protein
MEQSEKIKDDRMRQMDGMIQKLQQDFANLIKAMGASPSLVETELALKRKPLFRFGEFVGSSISGRSGGAYTCSAERAGCAGRGSNHAANPSRVTRVGRPT